MLSLVLDTMSLSFCSIWNTPNLSGFEQPPIITPQSVGQTVGWVHLGSFSGPDQISWPQAVLTHDRWSQLVSLLGHLESPPYGLSMPADLFGLVHMMTQAPSSAKEGKFWCANTFQVPSCIRLVNNPLVKVRVTWLTQIQGVESKLYLFMV